eukprot:TRINITY_DN23585_c0_g1_i1.p1 TRINITY_DN23585_c0_g1~~TRINITY_DN23585_c0_g1_i1.p1  ORF type:complete len:471 (+),score=192.18 TRINITY_DN23585_c0_g1_i1:116-1414(+)
MESDFVGSPVDSVSDDDDNTELGKEYDVSTAQDGGVTKTILAKGKGWDTPSKGSDVTVHYVGKLLDGTVFDSSRDRDSPFNFKLGLGQVIKGWDQGVASMKKGERALLTCQPGYAYGKSGSPPKIPPEATLQFEVELLDWTDHKDISDARDGGMMMKIVREGDGWDKPKDDGKVTVSYTVHTVDSNELVASAPRLTFVVGADEVPECLEKSVLEMKLHEKATVTVQPRYHSYGPAAVRLEIELLEFEKEKAAWEMSTDEKFEVAARKRQEGNELFKEAKYKRAAKKYKAAADLFQHDANLKEEDKQRAKQLKLPCWLNLAACELKLGQLSDCKGYCDKALEIDPLNVKALFRRGCVFAAQDNWAEAFRDFERALELDPKNKDVRDELAKLKKKQAEQNKKDKQLFGGMFEKMAKLEEAREKEREQKPTARLP